MIIIFNLYIYLYIYYHFNKLVLNDIGMSDYFSTDFVQNMSKIVGENFSEDDNFLPGRDLAKQYNLTAKYPIFIIPGITSCGLEVCLINFFLL